MPRSLRKQFEIALSVLLLIWVYVIRLESPNLQHPMSWQTQWLLGHVCGCSTLAEALLDSGPDCASGTFTHTHALQPCTNFLYLPFSEKGRSDTTETLSICRDFPVCFKFF